jgi:hypothetical protein
MVSTKPKDISGIEYYFTCTSGGGHDSLWQESQTYEDTSLSPGTTYTYTVKARDLSDNYNETAASSGASATTNAFDNILLPANGGVFEDASSTYTEYSGYPPENLTNGITSELGWASAVNPAFSHEFVYSFSGGNSATLSSAVLHTGTPDGAYHCKKVEVWAWDDTLTTPAYTKVAYDDALPATNSVSVPLDLGDTLTTSVKLVITEGHSTSYWELAEFEVYGVIVE